VSLRAKHLDLGQIIGTMSHADDEARNAGLPEPPMVTFSYGASFSSEEYEVIKRGLTPRSSDDKWHAAMNGDTLSLRRSGRLVYRVQFHPQARGRRVVGALVCDDATQYRRADDVYEGKFLDWVIRALILGQEWEMPAPTVVRRLPMDGPDRRAEAKRARKRAVEAFRELLARASALATGVRRRLQRLRRSLMQAPATTRLSDATVTSIAEREVRVSFASPWYAHMHWMSEPPGAWVTIRHPKGAFHDMDSEFPGPFFVDGVSGMVVRPKGRDGVRAFRVLERWIRAGEPGAKSLERFDWDAAPALIERWARVWLDDNDSQYAGISEDVQIGD